MAERKHFVTFYSPGTFFDEETTKPIELWDTELACAMAKSIEERYGSRPFGFRFTTALTLKPVDDGEGGKLAVEPKRVAASPMHFLGGEVLTLPEVEARHGADSILASNMRCNHWPRVIETKTPWRHVNRLEDGDVVLDPDTGRHVPATKEGS